MSNFKPNLDLVVPWEKTKYKIGEPPYIAVFKKDGKTLAYLAAKHHVRKTFEMVDFAFEKFNPQVAVVEYEHKGRPVEIHDIGTDKPVMHESVYTAALAVKNEIPVVLADTGYTAEIFEKVYKCSGNADWVVNAVQLKWIINNAMGCKRKSGKQGTLANEVENFKKFMHKDWMPGPPDEDAVRKLFLSEFGADFDSVDLETFLSNDWRAPKTGTIINQLHDQINIHVRDPFMLSNIANALNSHDVVFGIFGEGHYRSQRLVLEDMMGEPEYIWE